MAHSSTLRLELGARSYAIVFAALADADAALRALTTGRRLLTVADSNVRSYHGERLAEWFAQLTGDFAEYYFPAGEAAKTPETAIDLCRFAALLKCDRRTVMVALGGGVTGDLTGFAAAIYLRGIDFIQIPTTLLAMVDSSIGGKTGVDIPEGKNLIGAFHQPRLVVIDTAFLATLPERELKSGLAEVVKYAMLFDPAFFDDLAAHSAALLQPDLAYYGTVIRRCCEWKKQVVEADEHEQGCRALLNYGHTFGHALEKLSHYALTHGEGVAIGMQLAAETAVATGRLSPEIAARQRALLRALGLPDRVPPGYAPEAIVEAMTNDKKNSGGRIAVVLPTACGAAEVVRDCPPALLQRVIEANGR